MKAAPATPCLGADTSGKMTAAHARALVADGKKFVCRILCLPERSAASDLDAEELAMLTREGLAVFVYQFFRREGHNAATGLADAAAMIAAADAVGYPSACPIFVDLECEVTPSKANAEAYARA